MKYIRTKDGKIYDTTEWKNIRETHSLVVLMNKDRESVLLYKADIVKQADTIEELCDCFVVIRPQPKGNDYYTLHRFAYVKEHCLNGNEVVYGSIWVDGDLIKVAQMSEKGELELL